MPTNNPIKIILNTSQHARFIAFEANATRYDVVVTDGGGGIVLFADAAGRWVAKVPRHHVNYTDREGVVDALMESGQSATDAANIMEAFFTVD